MFGLTYRGTSTVQTRSALARVCEVDTLEQMQYVVMGMVNISFPQQEEKGT